MSIRTVVPAGYGRYLAQEQPDAAQIQEREMRLAAFPHCVMLEVAFPEIDYANRWCWQRFGPAHGICYSASSNYPACKSTGHHCHDGTWANCFLGKTDYDFGFNEWYFAKRDDMESFIEFVPQINWGERYP